MAFMSAIGPCICCGSIFCFNPERVPSTTAVTGNREPVCAACMALINAKRVRDGLTPFVILPGAYEGEDVA